MGCVHFRILRAKNNDRKRSWLISTYIRPKRMGKTRQLNLKMFSKIYKLFSLQLLVNFYTSLTGRSQVTLWIYEHVCSIYLIRRKVHCVSKCNTMMTSQHCWLTTIVALLSIYVTCTYLENPSMEMLPVNELINESITYVKISSTLHLVPTKVCD